MNWTFLADNLPHVTASLNASATVVLGLGLHAIKTGQARKHKKMMLIALAISALFLAIYLFHKVALYQATGEPNKKLDPDGVPAWFRMTYYWVLGTHLILAMTVPVLALRSIYLAMKGRIVAHKRLVKFTYPIWMYVSVTGVMVYAMLYHHHRFF